MTSATIPFLAKTKLTRLDDQLRSPDAPVAIWGKRDGLTYRPTDAPTDRGTDRPSYKMKAGLSEKIVSIFRKSEWKDWFISWYFDARAQKLHY